MISFWMMRILASIDLEKRGGFMPPQNIFLFYVSSFYFMFILLLKNIISDRKAFEPTMANPVKAGDAKLWGLNPIRT